MAKKGQDHQVVTKRDQLVPEVLDAEGTDESESPEVVVDDHDPVEGSLADGDDSLRIEVLDPDGSEPETVEAGDTAPVRYDPLNAYLAEIRRVPPLTKEEEQATAMHYYKYRDPESAYRLVSSNLWLVVKVARDYERVAKSLLDLIQEGNIGLMEAVKNYDPLRGVRFPSYAVWWIKAYIIRFIIANWRLVKIGTTQAQRKLFFNLKKETERLERQGIFPGTKLLADRLNVRESDITEMEQRLNAPDVSVDAPLQTDADSTLHSLLPSETPSAEHLLARKELWGKVSGAIQEFLKTLKEKERIIFEGRLLREDKLTLQEISEQLSISRERVRQIENRLKERFRDFLVEQAGVTSSELEPE